MEKNRNFKPINIFDFDGTLTTETWPKFWVWVKKFGYSGERRNDELENALAKYRINHGGNALETFFGFFNDLLVNNNQSISFEELMEGEKYIVYNQGVTEFLENSVAKNYIVSGGLRDFLKGLKISKYFDEIYGSDIVKKNEQIIGIGEIMTDEKKVQSIQDILRKNNREKNDCSNVYYIGDGYSDAVAMRFVHNNGGKAIFAHQKNENDELYYQSNLAYEALKADGIVDFRCIADYRKGTDLYKILQRED